MESRLHQAGVCTGRGYWLVFVQSLHEPWCIPSSTAAVGEDNIRIARTDVLQSLQVYEGRQRRCKEERAGRCLWLKIEYKANLALIQSWRAQPDSVLPHTLFHNRCQQHVLQIKLRPRRTGIRLCLNLKICHMFRASKKFRWGQRR